MKSCVYPVERTIIRLEVWVVERRHASDEHATVHSMFVFIKAAGENDEFALCEMKNRMSVEKKVTAKKSVVTIAKNSQQKKKKTAQTLLSSSCPRAGEQEVIKPSPWCCYLTNSKGEI